jgi:hypothetical protein
MARDQEHHALAPEMSATEIAELKSARWQRALEAALHEAGKELCDAEHAESSDCRKTPPVRRRAVPLDRRDPQDGSPRLRSRPRLTPKSAFSGLTLHGRVPRFRTDERFTAAS